MLYIFNGLIENYRLGEDSGVGVQVTQTIRRFDGELVQIVSDGVPLASWADKTICSKKVTLRYYISDSPITNPSECLQEYIERCMGKTYATFHGVYSELTGHLWTDQKFTVGGHDMIKVLESNLNKYIHMEILVD